MLICYYLHMYNASRVKGMIPPMAGRCFNFANVREESKSPTYRSSVSSKKASNGQTLHFRLRRAGPQQPQRPQTPRHHKHPKHSQNQCHMVKGVLNRATNTSRVWPISSEFPLGGMMLEGLIEKTYARISNHHLGDCPPLKFARRCSLYCPLPQYDCDCNFYCVHMVLCVFHCDSEDLEPPCGKPKAVARPKPRARRPLSLSPLSPSPPPPPGRPSVHSAVPTEGSRRFAKSSRFERVE